MKPGVFASMEAAEKPWPYVYLLKCAYMSLLFGGRKCRVGFSQWYFHKLTFAFRVFGFKASTSDGEGDGTLNFRQLDGTFSSSSFVLRVSFSTEPSGVRYWYRIQSFQKARVLPSVTWEGKEEGTREIKRLSRMHARTKVPAGIRAQICTSCVLLWGWRSEGFLWCGSIPDGQECKCQVTFLGPYKWSHSRLGG